MRLSAKSQIHDYLPSDYSKQTQVSSQDMCITCMYGSQLHIAITRLINQTSFLEVMVSKAHFSMIKNFDKTFKFNNIRHSIVASIPACHAGDQGSIPCDGVIVFLTATILI